MWRVMANYIGSDLVPGLLRLPWVQGPVHDSCKQALEKLRDCAGPIGYTRYRTKKKEIVCWLDIDFKEQLNGKRTTIVLPKPMAQFSHLKKNTVAQFLFWGGKYWKNCGSSKNPQGFPAKRKTGGNQAGQTEQ